MTNQNNLSFTIEDMEKVTVYRDEKIYNHFVFRKDHIELSFFEEDKIFKQYSVNTIYPSVTDYFEDWMNPTMTEVSLFELTTGLKYITYFLGLTE